MNNDYNQQESESGSCDAMREKDCIDDRSTWAIGVVCFWGLELDSFSFRNPSLRSLEAYLPGWVSGY